RSDSSVSSNGWCTCALTESSCSPRRSDAFSSNDMELIPRELRSSHRELTWSGSLRVIRCLLASDLGSSRANSLRSRYDGSMREWASTYCSAHGEQWKRRCPTLGSSSPAKDLSASDWKRSALTYRDPTAFDCSAN